MPNEITFCVGGWPPAKDGGDSIFNPKHSRHPLVRDLLSAAGDAIVVSGWRRVESPVPIGLELVVSKRAALDGRADPANYIGGVCDVLQSERRNVKPSCPASSPGTRCTRTTARCARPTTARILPRPRDTRSASGSCSAAHRSRPRTAPCGSRLRASDALTRCPPAHVAAPFGSAPRCARVRLAVLRAVRSGERLAPGAAPGESATRDNAQASLSCGRPPPTRRLTAA